MQRRILTIAGISLIFFTTVLSLGLSIYREYQRRMWYQDGNFFLLDTKALSITLFSPNDKKIYTYVLPPDAYLTVPGGYGMYKLKNIGPLSIVEKKDETLLIQSIEQVFGIPVDATNQSVTLWDQLLLFRAKQLYTTEQSVTLASENIFNTERRPDGEEIETISPDLVDRYLQERLWDRHITDEKLTVGIFNATAEVGLASSVARLLEHSGFRIVEVTNNSGQPIESSVCEIRAGKQAVQSYTASRIQRLLHCSNSLIEPDNRYDIMVILHNGKGN